MPNTEQRATERTVEKQMAMVLDMVLAADLYAHDAQDMQGSEEGWTLMFIAEQYATAANTIAKQLNTKGVH